MASVTHVVEIDLSPVGGGIVDPPAGLHTFDHGTIMPFIITPNSGYELDHIEVVTGSETQLYYQTQGQLYVTGDVNLIVVFKLGEWALHILRATPEPFEGGSIIKSGGMFCQNSIAHLQAIPNPGYTFIAWAGDVSSTLPSTSILMDETKSVIAVFVSEDIVLGLAISPIGSGYTTPAVGLYVKSYGVYVSVGAHPNPGYEFDHWASVDGSISQTASVVISIRGNTVLTAHFKSGDALTYTLTVLIPLVGSGTVDIPSGVYIPGSSVTLTATPSLGFEFDHWEGGVTGTSPSVLVEMNGNTVVTAVFRAVATPPPVVESPSFEVGTTHTAYVSILNPTVTELTYDVEAYLGESKDATSGPVSVTVPAGGEDIAACSITMPLTQGEKELFVDVSHDGVLLLHHPADTGVIIFATPEIDIGEVTWT